MFFILSFLLLFSFQAYATVSASVEYPTVNEGQIIELHLSSDSQKATDPDIQVLDQDFRVIGTSPLVSYQNINGKISWSYNFILNMLPLKTGILTIPAIGWGNEKTQPIQIKVMPAQQSATLFEKNTVSIKGEILERQVYEDAALIYRAQVVSDINFIDGQFIPPQMQDADVHVMGNIRFGRQVQDDTVFYTLTQDYAIYPKQIGTQEIKGAMFQGYYEKQERYQHSLLEPLFYDSLGIPFQEVSVRADHMNVSVLPRPDSLPQKKWLPANKLTATQTFSPSVENRFHVGDSLTRTIEINAFNVMGVQIPDIVFDQSQDFKIYAETPTKETEYLPSTVVGQMKQSFVFVPLRAGDLTLPEIKIEWFNTTTHEAQTTILPAQNITVQENPLIENKLTETSPPEKIKPQIKKQPNPYEKENNFLYFLAGLCTSLIVVMLILVLFFLRPKKKKLPDLYPKE